MYVYKDILYLKTKKWVKRCWTKKVGSHIEHWQRYHRGDLDGMGKGISVW